MMRFFRIWFWLIIMWFGFLIMRSRFFIMRLKFYLRMWFRSPKPIWYVIVV